MTATLLAETASTVIEREHERLGLTWHDGLGWVYIPGRECHETGVEEIHCDCAFHTAHPVTEDAR
jgi:hypothetical protein